MGQDDNLIDKYNQIFVSQPTEEQTTSMMIQPTNNTQSVFQTTDVLENVNVSPFKTERIQCNTEKPKR